MTPEETASHVGFGDGMRMRLGHTPVDMKHPDAIAFPDAYQKGFQKGVASITKLQSPSPAYPFWDRYAITAAVLLILLVAGCVSLFLLAIG